VLSLEVDGATMTPAGLALRFGAAPAVLGGERR
jgi:hypothetical protein